MSEVRARLAPGRAFGAGDFADLTDVPVVGEPYFGEDGLLVVEFDGELDPDAAAKVRRRIVSTTPSEEALRCDLADAAATTSDTPADDLAAQVAALTQQLAILTRLVAGDHA